MKRHFSVKTIILYTISVVVISLALIYLGGLLFSWTLPQKVSITGQLTINGYFPEGKSMVRTYGREITNDKTTASFSQVGQDRAAQQVMQYTWPNAKNDHTYQAYMALIVDGKEVAKSGVETVKAPATDIGFIINSSLTPPKPDEEYQTLSGTVLVNGSIPAGATLTIEGKKSNATDWNVVAENIPAAASVQWTYNDAEPGATYNSRARLVSNGTNFGTSNVVTLTAPARNIQMTINSTFVPPQQPKPVKTSVSGTINLNGSVPGSSSFRVLSRKAGSGDYQVVADNIAVVNGVRWEWNGAYEGTSYDFKAQLMQFGTVLSEAYNTNVSAPSSSVNFTVVTNAPLSAPPTAPRTSCDSKYNNVWNAATTVDSIKDNSVRQYWLMVGTQPGFNDVLNVRWAANTDLEYRFALNNIVENTQYFTQYAWSTCADCTATGQFSPFTRSSFRCPQQ